MRMQCIVGLANIYVHVCVCSLLCAVTNHAVWMAPDLQDCPTVVKTLSDLEQITVTNGEYLIPLNSNAGQANSVKHCN